VPEANADEIDEIGYEVTARAERLLASAHERRSESAGPGQELAEHIATIEEQTAVDLEQSEHTLHELAAIKRRAEAATLENPSSQ
jgi:hypothetical protein